MLEINSCSNTTSLIRGLALCFFILTYLSIKYFFSCKSDSNPNSQTSEQEVQLHEKRLSDILQEEDFFLTKF